MATGEFLALLGPAGAGKSAVLALLAGFLHADAGEILWRGDDLSGVSAHRRGFGVVFAGANLFGHLTVAENIALPLHRRPRAERRTEVGRLVDLLRLREVAALRPAALSPFAAGRAALARALAGQPPLLLLDEPFAGCDPATRAALAADLARLHQALGFAVILATRDAAAARALADRIAVLLDGTIAQAGPPRELYDRPAGAAVAICMGEVNRLPGRLVTVEDGQAEVLLDNGPLVEATLADAVPAGGRCDVLVRPERVALAAASAAELGPGAIPAVIRTIRDQGDQVVLELAAGDSPVVVRRPTAAGLAPGRAVAIAWQPQHAWACFPLQ